MNMYYISKSNSSKSFRSKLSFLVFLLVDICSAESNVELYVVFLHSLLKFRARINKVRGKTCSMRLMKKNCSHFEPLLDESVQN